MKEGMAVRKDLFRQSSTPLRGQHSLQSVSEPTGLPPRTPLEPKAETILEAFAKIRDEVNSYRNDCERLDCAIEGLTHGQYQGSPGWDKRHTQTWRQIFALCRAWAEAHADGPYIEFKTESDWLDYAAKKLKSKNGQGLPTGIYSAMKLLQKEAAKHAAR